METPKYTYLVHQLEHIIAPDRCILVGSALLACLGLRDVNDLDVLVPSRELDAIVEGSLPDDNWQRTFDQNTVVLKTPEGLVIQVSDRLDCFAASRVLSEMEVAIGAEMRGAWKVMSLAHLVAFKRAVGREKDLDDLTLLRKSGRL
jgi:hypothetical protein